MTTRPKVSVIVPVYNDPVGVQSTVASLVVQTYPTEGYEVVVVDNDSDDETPAVVASFANRFDDLLHVAHESTRGAYAARNTGIEHASGEVLVFLDADEIVPETFLAAVVDRLAETGADYLGCAVQVDARTVDPDSIAAKYNEVFEFPVGGYMEHHDFAPTCGMVVRRSVVDAVGTFDETLVSSGDREFGNRVAAAGFDMHYADDITVTHPARSMRDLLRKRIRVGRGITQLRDRHPAASSHDSLRNPWLYLPPLSPARLTSSAATVQSTSDRSLSLVDMVGLYCLEYVLSLAIVVGRLYERLRR